MNKSQMVKLAVRCCKKHWDYDQLKYGDDLYGKEHLADAVWDLVEERELIGSAAFDAKYADELSNG